MKILKNKNAKEIYLRVLRSRGKEYDLSFSGCIFDEPFVLRDLIKNKPKLAGYIGCVMEHTEIEDIPDISVERPLKNIYIIQIKFIKNIYLVNTVFNCGLILHSELFNRVYFRGTKFLEFTNFSKSNFSGKAYFEGSTFSGKAYFVRSTFAMETDFSNSTFLKEANFTEAAFLGIIDFSNSTFWGEASFNGSDFSLISYFFKVKFKEMVSFKLINLTGTLILQGNEYQALDVTNAAVSGHLVIEPEIENKKVIANRETARLLKHSALAQHNNIAAMNYKAREMTLYKEELQKKKRELKPIMPKIIKRFFNFRLTKICKWLYIIFLSWWKQFRQNIKARISVNSDILLLNLNRLSNNHGLSWGRGVIFTMVVALIFYIVTIAWGTISETVYSPIWHPSEWHEYFGTFWKGYIGMLNILNFNPQDIINDLNAFGTTMFFVSRIFISYGIYQTVSAFRKHGRT